MVGILAMHIINSWGESKIPVAVAGDLVCDHPIWQVGVVNATQGKTLEHQFVLRNSSKETAITIAEVKTNCGCLVTKHPEVIKPLESANVSVALSIPPLPGSFRQELVVLQENGKRPLALTVVGKRMIDAQLKSFPDVVNFGAIGRQARPSRTIYVQRRDHSRVHVKEVVAEHPALRATVTATGPDRIAIDLELLADAAFAEDSNFRTSVFIATEGAQFTELKIPVTASLAREDNSLVKSIFIARLEPGASSKHPLFSAGSRPMNVDTISFIGDSAIRVQLIDGERHTPYVLVARNRNQGVGELAHGIIRVRLQENSRVLEVPVTVFCVNSR